MTLTFQGYTVATTAASDSVATSTCFRSSP